MDLLRTQRSAEQEEKLEVEREIDVWSFDSKSCVKCGVPTYYHTAHVYFKATICPVTKLMVGSVYTQEHFMMIDLGMNGPFGRHPDSHFYFP